MVTYVTLPGAQNIWPLSRDMLLLYGASIAWNSLKFSQILNEAYNLDTRYSVPWVINVQ